MKVFLHQDKLVGSEPWHKSFKHLLELNSIPFIEFDISKKNALDVIHSSFEQDDCFVGRLKHDKKMLAEVKPIYNEICDLFNNRCFPSRQSFATYDDKISQFNLFSQNGYPIPKTFIINEPDDLGRVTIPGPYVHKLPYGASSQNVKKLDNLQGIVEYPCIVQEYCPGNQEDIRLTVIGNRVMGYTRLNRPGDFRASGSGRLCYRRTYDRECLELVYRISKENCFESMAYDLIRNVDGRWLVLEMSYTFVDLYVRNCPYFYDMRDGSIISKSGISASVLILLDFFYKKYGIVLNSGRTKTISAGNLQPDYL